TGEATGSMIGEITGSELRIRDSVETTGGWTSSVLPLGVPRNVNPVDVRNPTVRASYECGSTDNVRSACLRLNRAQGPRGNHPNQVVSYNEGQGCGNQENQARGIKGLWLGFRALTGEATGSMIGEITRDFGLVSGN
nr:hypothetical protein [Tanacetum cinerariifolium]